MEINEMRKEGIVRRRGKMDKNVRNTGPCLVGGISPLRTIKESNPNVYNALLQLAIFKTGNIDGKRVGGKVK